MDNQEGASAAQSDIHVLLQALYDTFVKYLQHEVIATHIPNMDSSLTDAADLLNWVLDDDDVDTPSNRHEQFLAAIKEVHKSDGRVIAGSRDGCDVGNNVEKFTDLLIQILDGSLVQKLMIKDVHALSQEMQDANLIPKKIHSELISKLEIETPAHICMTMFQNVKRGKTDWPFQFIEAVIKLHPELKVQWPKESSKSDEECGFTGSLPDFATSIDDPDDIYFSGEQRMHVTKEEYNNNIMQYILNIGAMDSNQVSVESILDLSKLSIFDDPGFSDDDEKYENEEEMCEESDDQDLHFRESGPSKKRKVDRSKQSISGSKSNSTPISRNDPSIKETEKVATSSPVTSLDLRRYQIELSQAALKGQNTIICAPTGSGKTRVSTYIILNHLQNEGIKKVAFLARTVPLVIQQYYSLKKYLPSQYRINQVTGESEHRREVHSLLPDLDIVVMTPKILENHITKGELQLSAFTLMVFDECHHTRKDEPYNTLMLNYLKTKKEEPHTRLPQIVGLTASIGVENAGKIDEAIKNVLKICANLDCDNISTVRNNVEELKKTVPVPVECMDELRERESDPAVKSIEQIMNKLEMCMKSHAQDLQDPDINKMVAKIPPRRKSQEYNQWAVKLRSASMSVPLKNYRETNISVRCLIILADYLKEYNVALEAHDLVQLEDVMQYLQDTFEKYKATELRTSGEVIFYGYFQDLQNKLRNRHFDENENLNILAIKLQKYLIESGPDSCGIIFVRTRALAFALTSWLKRCGIKELQDLNAHMFTGAGAKVNQLGMTQKDQEAVIEKFRDGETRLLVATTVAEEGLDIPKCNLVIKYNHVGNEVTTVQTRGRTRKRDGMSILLAMDKVRSKEIVNRRKAELMNHAIESVAALTTKEILKENANNQDEMMNIAEKNKLLRERSQNTIRDENFTLVCTMCRKVKINSEFIKTIEGVHRVVIQKKLWTQIKIIPSKEPHCIDEARVLGRIRCNEQPEHGKNCFNHLGTMLIYKKTPFVCLSLKNFTVYTGENQELCHYNKWKAVPYRIDELSSQDIKRYLPEEMDSCKQKTDVEVKQEKQTNEGTSVGLRDDDNTQLKQVHEVKNTQVNIFSTSSRCNILQPVGAESTLSSQESSIPIEISIDSEFLSGRSEAIQNSFEDSMPHQKDVNSSDHQPQQDICENNLNLNQNISQEVGNMYDLARNICFADDNINSIESNASRF